MITTNARTPHRCARDQQCVNVTPDTGQTRYGDAECPCECHGMPTPYALCSFDEGCGHFHHEIEMEPAADAPLCGGAILTPEGLCEGCTRRVASALAELPTDYVELNLLLASGESGIFTDIVTGTRELPIPIRVSVEALQASIVHEAQAWAEPVAERLGIDWDTARVAHCRPGHTLQRASQLLANAVGTLLALPAQEYRHHATGEWHELDGIDGAIELLRLHDLVRFVAGKTKLVHRLPAPCPRCERMSLVRHNGSEVVQCEGCGVRWGFDDYTRLTLILAEDYREFAA